jgi:hypothetical protein
MALAFRSIIELVGPKQEFNRILAFSMADPTPAEEPKHEAGRR